MIGWVHLYNGTQIHPVLCWYSHDGDCHMSVLTTTGRSWYRSVVVPLDTEAEVAALLLQGYSLMTPAPRTAKDTVNWLRWYNK